jgi:hypothetical protein
MIAFEGIAAARAPSLSLSLSLSLPRKRERGRSRSAILVRAPICSHPREAGEGWGGGYREQRA